MSNEAATTNKGSAVIMKPIDEFKSSLTKMEGQFKMALPPQIDPQKFIRVVMTAVGNNPELLNANRTTLWAACMKCAADGLLPDGREAALVTFGQDVNYMPMIGGILKKVRNSGELSSITSNIVYKNDVFKYWVDEDGEHIKHEPELFGSRGDAIGVYALAKTKDGAVYIEVMDKAQVLAVKSMSKTKKVWEGAFEHEMWRKSAIRRLSKRLPMSTDLAGVIERIDEDIDLEKSQTPQETSSSRLKEAIESQQTTDKPSEDNPL
jgi:recombination protein RecT